MTLFAKIFEIIWNYISVLPTAFVKLNSTLLPPQMPREVRAMYQRQCVERSWVADRARAHGCVHQQEESAVQLDVEYGRRRSRVWIE